MATPGVLYQEGDHASRPAQGSGCVLYACTDHSLVYRDDGSAWSTWATLGGGGGGWDLNIDESGASYANFTTQSGTWASSGAMIQKTSGTVAPARASHNTLVPIGLPTIMEVECRAPSASQTTSGDMAMGFIYGAAATPGAGSILPGIRWDSGATNPRVIVENDANALNHTRNVAGLVYDTWYTLRCVFGGGRVSIYIAGVNSDLPILSGYVGPLATGEKVGLATTQGLKADFRNFKVWTPTQP